MKILRETLGLAQQELDELLEKAFTAADGLRLLEVEVAGGFEKAMQIDIRPPRTSPGPPRVTGPSGRAGRLARGPGRPPAARVPRHRHIVGSVPQAGLTWA